MATHTAKDESADVYGDKREEDTAAAAVVVAVAHHSTAERGPSRPGTRWHSRFYVVSVPYTGLGGD